jgi:hypothetical protein
MFWNRKRPSRSSHEGDALVGAVQFSAAAGDYTSNWGTIGQLAEPCRESGLDAEFSRARTAAMKFGSCCIALMNERDYDNMLNQERTLADIASDLVLSLDALRTLGLERSFDFSSVIVPLAGRIRAVLDSRGL